MGIEVEARRESPSRETVPFRVRTADGDDGRARLLLAAAGRDPRRTGAARVAAVVRAGQAAPQLHAPRDRLLRRGRADLGTPLGRRGDRDAARGARLPADRERDPAGVRARSGSTTTRALPGNADLGRLQAQFDEYYQALEDNGVRVNYIEPPVPAIGAYGYIKNLVTLAGGGLVVHGGAIVHRYGLGSWQRGREVIWEKVLAALQVPIYLTIHGKGICEPGAGRWLDAKTFVFNESVVANEEGLRQLEFVLSNLGIELDRLPQPGLVRHDRAREHRHLAHGHGHAHRRPPEGAARPAPRQLRLRPRADPPRLHDHRGAGRGVLGSRPERRHALARQGRDERRLADRRRRRSSATTSR